MVETMTLVDIRRKTRLSRSHMARIIGRAWGTYVAYEKDNYLVPARLMVEVADNFDMATQVLARDGFTWVDVMPLGVGARTLGLSTGQTLALVPSYDFAMFGLWVTRDDVEECLARGRK